MLLSEHDSATCPSCGSPLLFGLKEEVTCWKVFYVCESEEGCGAECRLGRVSLESVDTMDEAYERAEKMWEQVSSVRKERCF